MKTRVVLLFKFLLLQVNQLRRKRWKADEMLFCPEDIVFIVALALIL